MFWCLFGYAYKLVLGLWKGGLVCLVLISLFVSVFVVCLWRCLLFVLRRLLLFVVVFGFSPVANLYLFALDIVVFGALAFRGYNTDVVIALVEF